MDALSEIFTKFGVVIGPRGHRRWPENLKALIVAETLEPGATVSEVARKYDLRSNHLSAWRRMARDGKLVLPAPPVDAEPVQGPVFAPMVVEPLTDRAEQPPTDATVEIVHGDVVIRLGSDAPATRIAEIARALSG